MKASPILTTPLGRVIGLTICSVASTACCALSAQTTGGKGGPPKPPAEALASCKALSSGAECSFASPQGTVTGTCWAPEGKPLACKPKGPPPGPPPGGSAGGSAGAKGTSAASTSQSFDPADTNQDGTVSELERLAHTSTSQAANASDSAATTPK